MRHAPQHRRARPRARRCATAALLAAGLLALLSPAHAAEPEVGRVTVDVAPLYAYVVLDQNEEPSGAGCALAVGYRLTEAIAVGLTGLWSVHDVPAAEERPGGALHLIGIAAGGRYALDVLSIAPTLEAGVELLHRRLAGAAATDLAVLVGLSARHWISDWLALGVQLYYHAFLTDLRNFPIYVNVGPTVAVRF